MKEIMKSNEKLIDLIIPCYQAKNTLERLFASILVQTIKNNIYVILVQDCDEEDYFEVISKFENMLDIKLIKLEKNSGPGACRRIGTQNGNSKYVMYMDADDTFQNPFAAEELLNKIETENLDAVNSIFLEQLFEFNFEPHRCDWIWVFGKIYKRAYLEDNRIEMNNSRANEDTGFNMIVQTHGKTGYLNDTTYIWHFKEDSITRKDGGIYRFTGIEGWIYNMIWAIDNLIRLKVDESTIKTKISGIMVSTYVWYNEFLRDKDIRINTNLYLSWIKNFVNKIYNLYTPTEELIEQSYREQSNSKGLTEFIPEISFKDYLRLVGAKDAK